MLNKLPAEMLSSLELRKIKSLNSPYKVQEFVDSLEYNTGKRVSVADVLRKRKADCLEAACFAMYVLRKNGFESFIMDFGAYRDEDHVICVFKEKGLYGAIAQSKFIGLRYRHPVYKTLRELAMSYFNNYFSYQGYFSLRNFSKMSLDNLPEEWIDNAKFIVKIENDFAELKHEELVPKNIKLPPASKLKFQREIVLFPKYAKVAKRYK